jgi:hypothetical protein
MARHGRGEANCAKQSQLGQSERASTLRERSYDEPQSLGSAAKRPSPPRVVALALSPVAGKLSCLPFRGLVLQC